jgi:hypothetical protein
MPSRELHVASLLGDHRSNSRSPFAEVTPNLFLSDYQSACDLYALEAAGITHIINVADGCINRHPEHFQYLSIGCRDRSYEVLTPYFSEVAAFAAAATGLPGQRSARDEGEGKAVVGTGREPEGRGGGKVLVHCQFGISRSVAFILAILMINHSYTLDSALRRVKQVRSEAEPNPGFMWQLRELDRSTTAQDKAIEGDSLDRAVGLLTSTHAIDHLSPSSLYDTTKPALIAVFDVEPQERLPRLMRIWRTVCENYATPSERDERARRAYGELWRIAIEQGLVFWKSCVTSLGAMRKGDEWKDLLLDVPLAEGYLEVLISVLRRQDS